MKLGESIRNQIDGPTSDFYRAYQSFVDERLFSALYSPHINIDRDIRQFLLPLSNHLANYVRSYED